MFKNLNSDVQFCEYVGINRPGSMAVSVLEHFLLFFPMRIIEQITKQTLLYYKQENAKKTLPAFRANKEEIMAS